LFQEEAKNDGAAVGRGLSEVCYGAKYLSAMKKEPEQPFFLLTALTGFVTDARLSPEMNASGLSAFHQDPPLINSLVREDFLRISKRYSQKRFLRSFPK
jgi:hypothetical protein